MLGKKGSWHVMLSIDVLDPYIVSGTYKLTSFMFLSMKLNPRTRQISVGGYGYL